MQHRAVRAANGGPQKQGRRKNPAGMRPEPSVSDVARSLSANSNSNSPWLDSVPDRMS